MSDADARLREVVDLVPDVLFRCYKDEAGSIYWSLNEGGLAKEFGLTTKEIEGKTLQELFAGGASDEMVGHFEAAFDGETETFVNEIDGRFFKHCPQPIFEDGDVVEVVGFITEVTELVETQQQLKTANQDLDAFAHSASHDLQLPLTVIRNLVTLAEVRGEMTTDWHERMDDAVARMSNIIDSLLTFSRSGTGAIRPQELDVAQIARDSARMLDAQGGRQVEWDIEDGLTARGDPAMMRIVMDNLLGNAWKYTRDVEAARIRVFRDGHNIAIEDNGSGIEIGEEEQIFKPFHQGAGALPGSGIGLATVRRIIERLGGNIMAEQAPDGGASFKIRLPEK